MLGIINYSLAMLSGCSDKLIIYALELHILSDKCCAVKYTAGKIYASQIYLAMTATAHLQYGVKKIKAMTSPP